jgi:hypothetical protein
LKCGLNRPFTHPPGRNDLQATVFAEFKVNPARHCRAVNDLEIDHFAIIFDAVTFQ